MRFLLLILLASLSACSPAREQEPTPTQSVSDDLEGYQPSVTQIRVDQSFSEFPIETSRQNVEARLSQVIEGGCAEYIECDWVDEAGVRHYFFLFSDEEHLLVVKSVLAEDYVNRPISALGIGLARGRDEVLSNVRKFLSEIEVECQVEGDGERCDGTLLPGWIRLWFDENGNLTEARFDGYHFT
jgi:hypothetical protein